MKKLLLLGFFIPYFLFFQTSILKAQVIVTINGQETSKEEFLYAFNKNRNKDEPIVLDSLEKYLEQFINFKLKVRAARAEGFDQSEAFKKELSGYISQIKKPYLQSSETQNDLLIDIYKRMQEDINASHILIKISPNAEPSDSLKAYRFLDSLRTTINSSVEFESLAQKYSQDGSAQNGGNLGWFTALQMVGPFEEMAYLTPENEVSEVVRSQFGYHLIFVNKRRPNQGKVKTSHIFFTKQRGSEEAMQRAQMVYDSLKKGSEWDRMARLYSDDKGTSDDGGKLPWASLKQLPDDFLEIAYSIEGSGEYSAPKKTSFGWHIIRLDETRPLEPFEVMKTEIEERLKRMGRNVLQEEQVIKKLKVENNFNFGPISLDSLIKTISQRSKDEIRSGILPTFTLFQHGNKTVSIAEFLNAIPGDQIKFSPQQIENFYTELEKEIIFNYEDSIAPRKYPEYGFLMKEYEEGLLLFDIMQEKVWNKATIDSIGLQNYYQDNLERYSIGEQLGCIVIEITNKSVIDKIKDFQPATLSLNKSMDSLQNWLKINGLDELKIAKSNVLASEFSNFESAKGNLGQWVITETPNKIYLPIVFEEAGILPLDEIKGEVMVDYQEMLDQEWIKVMRKSVKIKINKRVLREIAGT